MGGYGSGRYLGYTKTKVEDCHIIDANNYAKWKLFKPGPLYLRTFWSKGGKETASCGVYSYITKDDALVEFIYNDRRVRVNLTWYEPGYGGRRYLFLCPICGRRVRTMHFKGLEIACRICHDLTYTSCNESHYFDKLYKRMAAGEKYSWKEVKQAINFYKREARMKPRKPRGRPRKSQ
jgi:hypothetical protein